MVTPFEPLPHLATLGAGSIPGVTDHSPAPITRPKVSSLQILNLDQGSSLYIFNTNLNMKYVIYRLKNHRNGVSWEQPSF